MGVPGTCQGEKESLRGACLGLWISLGDLGERGRFPKYSDKYTLCAAIGFHSKLLQPRYYESILVSQRARLFLHLKGIIYFLFNFKIAQREASVCSLTLC